MTLSEEILGIVFDFDGVLIPESEKVNIAAATQTFSSLGFPLTSEEIASIPGKSSRTVVPILLRKRDFGQEEDEKIVSRYRKNYDAIWPSDATIAPRLVEVLTFLKENGLALAIATTNRRVIVERFLVELLPMQNPFRIIVSGEEVRHHKPHPEVYLRAAELLELPPEKLIAVEDTSVGVRAAKAAGMRCAAIPNLFTNDQDFSEADYRLGTFRELTELAKRRQ